MSLTPLPKRDLFGAGHLPLLEDKTAPTAAASGWDAAFSTSDAKETPAEHRGVVGVAAGWASAFALTQQL